jgi:CPA1 family monovalent cation:H+ antiporter
MADAVIPHAIELLVGLLLLAAVVAILAGPLRLPDTVALVIAGLLVGLGANAAGYPSIDVSPEVVLLVLLPGLVFEAAYRLRLVELRRWFGALLLLAIPGVLISAAVVAVVLTVATGLRFDLAFIVGAMVSATDPAAVVATFKRLPVPDALATLIDGESLLNDGTGLVLFAIAVAAVSTPVSAPEAIVAFAGAVGVSLVIGLVAGFAASWLIRLTSDRLIELTITVVLAYGSYILADQFHLSGVIATVTAGIVLGNAPNQTLSEDGRDAIDTVWEFFAYLLTAVVFLLVGLAIPPMRLLDSLGPIAWGIVAVVIGRALVVYVLLGGASRIWRGPGFEGPLAPAWLHVIFWAGLRGAVAVAMALALPADIPQRDTLQEITFGVVLFTLLVQGTTIGQLIDRTVRVAPAATLAPADAAPAADPGPPARR